RVKNSDLFLSTTKIFLVIMIQIYLLFWLLSSEINVLIEIF
ncbi:MAG: hypothetical protein RLZZ519_1058, partial [Bacteroidota bacterium]